MNIDDVERAVREGRISGTYAHALNELILRVSRMTPPGSASRKALDALVVREKSLPLDPGESPSPPTASVKAPQNLPGALALYERLHQGAVRDVDDAEDLARLDTFRQMQSVVRARTNTLLAKAIRDVMNSMKPWFDRDAFVIPRGREELRAPSNAETFIQDDVELAIIPWRRFAELFEVKRVDPLLALVRRAAERMGRHFTDVWHRRNGRTVEALQATELLQSLRSVGFGKTMGNGFASGVLDVVNPLHILVTDVLRRRGPDAFTPAFEDEILRRHADFSVFLATFSLACVAGLENLLGVPATRETLEVVSQWTSAVQDVRGKGFPLDCNFSPEYFDVRETDAGTAPGIPIVDFRIGAFSETELDAIASRTIRLGCPSLGAPHRQFTQAMGRAYFQAIFPVLSRGSMNPDPSHPTSGIAGE